MDTLKLKPMILLLLFHYLLMSDIAHNVIFLLSLFVVVLVEKSYSHTHFFTYEKWKELHLFTWNRWSFYL